jgi:hypothetical protein
MALPTQLKNKLDDMHDTLTSNNLSFVVDKISFLGNLYKIKLSKTIKSGKVFFDIQILEK